MPSEMSAEAALAAAKAASPMPVSHIATDDDPTGLIPGMTVTVTPGRQCQIIPASGMLIAADARDIILRTTSRPATFISTSPVPGSN